MKLAQQTAALEKIIADGRKAVKQNTFDVTGYQKTKR